MVEEMQNSLLYWLRANYRSAGVGQGMAQDDSPAMMMRKAMDKLSRRWQRRFDQIAEELGKRFADRALKNTDVSLSNALEQAGMTVKFRMTAPMNDAYQAVVGEQVGLIKSIASQHLGDVQGVVMRSVQTGRDLGQLSKELQERYGVTKRRAALIARDQNNKATGTIQRARHESLGITEGIWKHSHAGKVPRASHVAANGKRFSLKAGMVIDGKPTWPGHEINCRCTYEAVIPGFE